MTTVKNKVHYYSIETKFIILIDSYKSDVAYEAITACTEIIKNGLSLESLVDKLLEERIINDKEKSDILDTYSGLTANQRMDKVLDIVKKSIKVDGDKFGLFIEIIGKEDTERAEIIVEKLRDTYNKLNAATYSRNNYGIIIIRSPVIIVTVSLFSLFVVYCLQSYYSLPV